jgi:hypothetical protein
MVVWQVQFRPPGAGGAWTTVGFPTSITFNKEINQIHAMDFVAWGLTAGEQAGLVQGNDLRLMADARELFYGQIRSVFGDPDTNSRRVHALRKTTLLRDKFWTSRLVYTKQPADTIVKALVTMPDSYPRVALEAYCDWETQVQQNDPTGVATATYADLSFRGRPFNGFDNTVVFHQVPGIIGLGNELRYGPEFGRFKSVALYPPSGSPFTISAWIRLTAIVASAGVLIFKEDGSFALEFFLSTDGAGNLSLNLAFHDTVAPIDTLFTTGTVPFSTNVWHHVVVTNDGISVTKFYLDGVLNQPAAQTKTWVRSLSQHSTGGFSLRESINTMNFQIDELLIYSRVLSDAERISITLKGNIYAGDLLADEFPAVTFSADPADRLAIADTIAKSFTGEWWDDRDASDQDRFRWAVPRPYGQQLARDFALYYDMEHFINGLMQDFSSNRNHGTLTGTTDIVGRFGRGRNFNGTSDGLQAPNAPSLQLTTGMTLAAWVQTTTITAGVGTIMRKEGSYAIRRNGSALEILTWVATVARTDTVAAAFVAGTMVHVAVTYDGVNHRLYVNGVLQAAPARAGSIDVNTNPLWTGNTGGASEFFSGIIDEPYVFPRALTQAEITALAAVPPVFQRAVNVTRIEQKLDREIVRNDVVALGQGDGALQLYARTFHATTIRTLVTASYLAGSATSIPVLSTVGFPTQGVIYLGQERILYVGVDATHLGTTSVTRAYSGDGAPTYAGYDHSSGIEAYLHVDTSVTPNVIYEPRTPQAGSSVQVNTWRQEPISDRSIRNQDTLDRLAQRLMLVYKDPRESVLVEITSPVIAADVGDFVTVLNRDGTPYQNTPYRVIQESFDWMAARWRLELSNPRDLRDFALTNLQEAVDKMGSFTQGYIQQTGLASLITQKDIANTITETAILEYVIPANFVPITGGTTFRVKASGTVDFLSDAAPAAFAFRVRIGGVAGTLLIAFSPLQPVNVAATRPWNLDILVTCRTGATGAPIAASGVLVSNIPSNGFSDPQNGATVTADLTKAQTLSLTGQNGKAAVGINVHVMTAAITLEKP